jgi:hypothetical protein
MATRYAVFEKYQHYMRDRDDRPMDEICSTDDGTFSLQVQQQFLKDYIRENPAWDKLLLYHQIGSGKTCTAITIAEEYMRLNPRAKATVILPARLRTNFFDELISPCGMEAYISKADFMMYHGPDTSAARKRKIRSAFMEAIAKRYDIMSFEKFRADAIASRTKLQDWATAFTKDRIIIIDEVHNLFSGEYDPKKYAETKELGELSRSKGMNTMILRYLCEHAHHSVKMIFMTATPIFDNIGQFRELVRNINPAMGNLHPNSKISDIIDRLRGKVSFFPGTSANAYPKVEYERHLIPLTATQDEMMNAVLLEKEDENDENKEAFMMKQRQISVSCYADVRSVMSDMDEYAPRMRELLDIIKDNAGKHMVYSSFTQRTLNMLAEIMKKDGWVNLKDVAGDTARWNDHAHKVFTIWDGSVKDADKQLIKSIVNRKDNMDGRLIRVILGSPSVKEGISFKHIQHLHLLDPVWNQSAKTQVEGRGIRFCSHVDIPKNHPTLKKKVTVHVYMCVPRKGGLVTQTCDQMIYDRIIPHKQKRIAAAESALKKVAIDHYLFRNMYSEKPHGRPLKTVEKSPVSIDDDIIIKKVEYGQKKVKNTCPKPRRPVQGKCGPGEELRYNPAGFPCCYKASKGPAKPAAATKKKKCPAGRQPVDGKCAEGFYVKTNKHGIECCFKKTARA